MSKSKAAFPLVQVPGANFNPGISERTYIAVQAMQSLIIGNLYEYSGIPEVAYKIADAMIKHNPK